MADTDTRAATYQRAVTAANQTFRADVTQAADEMVQTVDAYAVAEKAWLAAPWRDDLAQTAQTRFQELKDARARLATAAQTARAKRDQARTDAWATATAP